MNFNLDGFVLVNTYEGDKEEEGVIFNVGYFEKEMDYIVNGDKHNKKIVLVVDLSDNYIFDSYIADL